MILVMYSIIITKALHHFHVVRFQCLTCVKCPPPLTGRQHILNNSACKPVRGTDARMCSVPSGGKRSYNVQINAGSCH